VAPDVLCELIFSLAYLAIIPPPSWQAELHGCAAAQIPLFSPTTAVRYLHALAMWKAAAAEEDLVTKGISGRSAMVGSSEAAATAAAVTGSASNSHSCFVYPAVLVDGLVYMTAAGLSRSADTLSAEGLRVLPQALRALSWPADEQLVAGFVQQLQYEHQQLQQRQDQLHKLSSTGSGPAAGNPGGRGGQHKQRSQSKQRRPAQDLLEQQAERRMTTLQEIQEHITANIRLIEGILKDWQMVLQQTEALATSSIGSSSVDSVQGSMLLKNHPEIHSAVQGRISPRQEVSIVEGSSSRLDIDDLMSGLMAASGLLGPSAAQSHIGSSSSDSAAVPVSSDAACKLSTAAEASAQLDELLSGLHGGPPDERRWLDVDDLHYGDDDQQQVYIDTTAADIVE
jgi:hypothetical protein